MSAGVSDQRMKGQGNQGMFGPSFGQQSSYNYFPNNGDYNTWGSQQINSAQGGQSSRKGPPYDDYYRDQSAQDGVKGVEQGMHGLEIGSSSLQHSQTREVATRKPEPTKETVPKKMTWASIASQPAKPQIRANSSSSILKKKGPGMPPPPMVPGKHNMDIGTWDSPSKSGPILVPPPVIQSPPPPMEPSPLSQTKPSHSSGGGGSGGSATQHGGGGPPSTQSIGTQGQQQQASGPAPMRPAWSNAGANRSAPHPGMIAPVQQQQQQSHRSNIGSGHGQPPIMGFQGHPQQQQGHAPHPASSQQQQQQHHQSPPHHQVQSKHQQQQQQHSPPQQQQSHNNRELFAASETTGSIGSLNNAGNLALDDTHDINNYNPTEFDFDSANNARFFVIKSYSEDDIHRSIKYEIWCSTEHGNKRLDQAYREREKDGGLIYLLFSVNGSGHFCGMAQMMTAVDYNSVSSVWSQDKWKGTFKVKWIYVKDVPNTQLRHIRLENNENKSVTNSRDTQEVPNPKAIQVLRILSTFKHTTSIFDDFKHYEKRQEEEDTKKVEPPMSNYDSGSNRSYHGGGGYDRGGGGGGYDKSYGGGGGYDRGGNKSYGGGQYGGRGGGGGGYNNYDNRRGGDDYNRGGGGGGYDRSSRDHQDGGYNRDGGDYHRNNRNEYRDQRRDDRGGGGGGYGHRDRDNNEGGGFMSRNDGRGGGGGGSRGGNNDYNRDNGSDYQGDRGHGRSGFRN